MGMKAAEINGTIIACHVAGTGDQALLLLHGAFLSHASWEPQFEAFSARYCIVAPDLRGHGQSGRGGRPYSLQQFAADMVQLLDTLGVERAAVVGHSMGGMVAQELAIRYPDRLWALVLAETSYGVRSRWYEALLTDLTIPLIRYVPVAWQADLYACTLGKYTPGVEPYVRREIGELAGDPGTVWAMWQAVMRFEARGRLCQIRAPTLVLTGEHFRQTHGQGRTMARLIPDAQWAVVEGAGHMLNWDNASQFTALVLAFLGEKT